MSAKPTELTAPLYVPCRVAFKGWGVVARTADQVLVSKVLRTYEQAEREAARMNREATEA